jgi:hypothetical protein
MNYYSYEIAAAKVFETDVKNLFNKCRKGSAPMVRHVLMYYRTSTLSKSPTVAAQRYGQHRCTALYAKDKVASWIELYPDVSEKYDEFIALSGQTFIEQVKELSLSICTSIEELVEITLGSDCNYRLHEKEMARLRECEQALGDLKKIISNRWKEQ